MTVVRSSVIEVPPPAAPAAETYVPPAAATPPPVAPPAAATPPPYVPPPVQPQSAMPPPMAGFPGVAPAPKAPNANLVALQAQLANVLKWDWKGPLVVAGSMLAVSFAMSLAFALLTKPSGPSFSFRTMLTYIVSYWNGTFGASVTGGNGGSTFGAGATPLTLTVITMLFGIFMFRRATRDYTSGVSGVLFALRTAAITMIPLLFVSWVVTMGAGDVNRYNNNAGSVHSWDQLDLRFFGSGFAGINGNPSATSVGVSSTGTFFFTLMLVFAVLASVALLRRDWFTEGVMANIRDYVVGPLRALGWLMLAVTVVGLVFNVLVLVSQAIDHGSLVPSGNGSMHFQDWITLFGLLIAYSANAGLQAVGLGSAVHFGSFESGMRDGGGSGAHLLGFFAGGNQVDFGVWSALILAPLVLGFVAYRTVKAKGVDHRTSVRSVWTAPVGWLVLIPIVVVFANWSFSFSSNDGGPGSGHTWGLSALGATFLIPLYFLIIALPLAWLTGVLTPADFDDVKSLFSKLGQPRSNPQQAFPTPPPAYPGQPGMPPPYQPPAYQPPVAPPYQPPTAPPPGYQPPQAPPPYQPPPS